MHGCTVYWNIESPCIVLAFENQLRHLRLLSLAEDKEKFKQVETHLA
jgi:hypothetical protein